MEPNKRDMASENPKFPGLQSTGTPKVMNSPERPKVLADRTKNAPIVEENRSPKAPKISTTSKLTEQCKVKDTPVISPYDIYLSQNLDFPDSANSAWDNKENMSHASPATPDIQRAIEGFSDFTRQHASLTPVRHRFSDGPQGYRSKSEAFGSLENKRERNSSPKDASFTPKFECSKDGSFPVKSSSLNALSSRETYASMSHLHERPTLPGSFMDRLHTSVTEFKKHATRVMESPPAKPDGARMPDEFEERPKVYLVANPERPMSQGSFDFGSLNEDDNGESNGGDENENGRGSDSHDHGVPDGQDNDDDWEGEKDLNEDINDQGDGKEESDEEVEEDEDEEEDSSGGDDKGDRESNDEDDFQGEGDLSQSQGESQERDKSQGQGSNEGQLGHRGDRAESQVRDEGHGQDRPNNNQSSSNQNVTSNSGNKSKTGEKSKKDQKSKKSRPSTRNCKPKPGPRRKKYDDTDDEEQDPADPYPDEQEYEKFDDDDDGNPDSQSPRYVTWGAGGSYGGYDGTGGGAERLPESQSKRRSNLEEAGKLGNLGKPVDSLVEPKESEAQAREERASWAREDVGDFTKYRVKNADDDHGHDENLEEVEDNLSQDATKKEKSRGLEVDKSIRRNLEEPQSNAKVHSHSLLSDLAGVSGSHNISISQHKPRSSTHDGHPPVLTHKKKKKKKETISEIQDEEETARAERMEEKTLS